jgi:hypothetical protein
MFLRQEKRITGISLLFLMNPFDRSWNMKISSSIARSSGYRKRLSNWISGRNLGSRESESNDRFRGQNADEEVNGNELHLNLASLRPLLNPLAIPQRGHSIELYVLLS